MDGVVVGLGAGAVLLTVWVATNRRHVRDRGGRQAEWSVPDARPDLWTSAARCPYCRASGGLLETAGDRLWFVCLTCRERHERRERA